MFRFCIVSFIHFIFGPNAIKNKKGIRNGTINL